MVVSFSLSCSVTTVDIAVAQIVSNNYHGASLGAQQFMDLMGENGGCNDQSIVRHAQAD
jgi:erythritol transport system substrate-binding protein